MKLLHNQTKVMSHVPATKVVALLSTLLSSQFPFANKIAKAKFNLKKSLKVVMLAESMVGVVTPDEISGRYRLFATKVK